ncbi:hypothetical protein [Bacillus toyonensis]|uniref:hypothetical protein n=1 Tax=Bacillus toyonensis TaxID=155322 RepID=UPI003D658E24
MMMLSSPRRTVLSGWLKQNQPRDFSSDLKLQKFLFFYEALAKVEDDDYDFHSLKGYINGPVFSDVYGDCTYRKDMFIQYVEESYALRRDAGVNEERAKLMGFLVSILTEEELSELTHEFSIWNSKEVQIRGGAMHLPLDESDFTEADEDLILRLRDMYTLDYINSVDIQWVRGKCFIIPKEQSSQLTSEHNAVLREIATSGDVINPVYITLEDGVLLVD